VNWLLAVSIAAVGLGLSGHAHARDYARLVVEREASAAECPDEQLLRDAVTTRLGYEPFTEDAPSLVTVLFRRKGGTLHATTVLRGADGTVKGQRALTSAHGDCAAVASATTLTISILLDPRSGLVQPEAAAAAATPLAAEPAPVAPAPAAPAPVPPSNPPVVVAVQPALPPAPKKAPSLPADETHLLLSASGAASIGKTAAKKLGFLACAGLERHGWSISVWTSLAARGSACRSPKTPVTR
jgi:hypothetical protein